MQSDAMFPLPGYRDGVLTAERERFGMWRRERQRIRAELAEATAAAAPAAGTGTAAGQRAAVPRPPTSRRAPDGSRCPQGHRQVRMTRAGLVCRTCQGHNVRDRKRRWAGGR